MDASNLPCHGLQEYAVVHVSACGSPWFGIGMQIMVTWVYTHSGRNILSSTLFYGMLLAWNIVNFYPFGMPRTML